MLYERSVSRKKSAAARQALAGIGRTTDAKEILAMNKHEALCLLRATPEHAEPIDPGQKVEIELLRPEDAWKLARLFYEVYGDGYPMDLYYVPELLLAEIESGRLHCVVARTEGGDIVGHMALYRCAPSPLLYESGVGLVAPNYRIFSNIVFRLGVFITEELTRRFALHGMFCEAVCAHKAIQKLSVRMGHVPVALELDLIPDGIYSSPGGSRTSCVLVFESRDKDAQRIHIPECYQGYARYLYEPLPLRREFAPASESAPDGESRWTERLSTGAGLVRCSVSGIAGDFPVFLADFEARNAACPVRQMFLNLAEPQVGLGVKLLREHGYFFSGFLPRWFGSDALILQKLAAPTDYASIKLLEERSKRILELIREDRRLCAGQD